MLSAKNTNEVETRIKKKSFIKSKTVSFILNFSEPYLKKFEEEREPGERENVEQPVRKVIQGTFGNEKLRL